MKEPKRPRTRNRDEVNAEQLDVEAHRRAADDINGSEERGRDEPDRASKEPGDLPDKGATWSDCHLKRDVVPIVWSLS